MENRLTIKEFLRVFECVRSSGHILNDKYVLGELCAWHDYDGYTCWLGYKDVTVTLMFHGSLNIEFDHASNYSDFTTQCLSVISENHSVKES